MMRLDFLGYSASWRNAETISEYFWPARMSKYPIIPGGTRFRTILAFSLWRGLWREPAPFSCRGSNSIIIISRKNNQFNPIRRKSESNSRRVGTGRNDWLLRDWGEASESRGGTVQRISNYSVIMFRLGNYSENWFEACRRCAVQFWSYCLERLKKGNTGKGQYRLIFGFGWNYRATYVYS